jgi:hypothetical protein
VAAAVKRKNMNAIRRTLATRAAMACAVAAATLSALAINTGDALAYQHCGPAEKISGEGSALQGQIQQTWTVGVSPKGFNHSADASACNGTQGGKNFPSATFLTTTGEMALEAWGSVDGSLHGFGPYDSYMASDLGPGKRALEKMNLALGSELSVIPVAQTSIAVLANPPANCALTQISNVNLERAFRQEEGGSIAAPTWKQIGGTGAGCESGVKRVVPSYSTGATSQFKHYLFQINSTGVGCLRHGIPNPETWEALQDATAMIGATNRNREWPECEVSPGVSNEVIHESTPGGGGFGHVVGQIGQVDGSIGFAPLPDAESSSLNPSTTTILKVQDGEEAGAKRYASPAAAGSTANCKSNPYSWPQNEAETEQVYFTSRLHNLNWSKVYGSNPNVGQLIYPICMLTYDLVPVDASRLYGETKAQAIKDFLGYVIASSGGQADIKGQWFQEVPSGIASAAAVAVEAIH